MNLIRSKVLINLKWSYEAHGYIYKYFLTY